MQEENTVFERTYQHYISQIRNLPLASAAERIGAVRIDGGLRIPLFGQSFEVSAAGITDTDGRRPSYDVCVILSKRLLLSLQTPAQAGGNWVSFKDFRDSRPLHNFFAHDVEGAIAGKFSGRIKALKQACASLGGYAPDLQVSYDLAMQFDALPMIPLILLFNDADAEFQASSSILFLARTEAFLDAECIAMVGSLLCRKLGQAKLQENRG